MPAITLETAQASLAAYLAAEEKVLTGQSATVDGRTLQMADLASIQRGVKLWEQRVNVLENKALGRGRCRTVSPRW